jgi:Subtilase family
LKPRAPDSNQHLVVGLIDTSVQSLGKNLDAFIKPQLQAATQQTTPQPNQLNHGTAMAETILEAVQKQTGGTTSVSILPVDVYGGAETTTTFDVANGIKMAIDNGQSGPS